MKPFVKNFIDRLKKNEVPTIPSLGLKPLHPEYKMDGHDIYVRELNEAVAKDAIRNIALTGGYGSGKSSILSDFVVEQQSKDKKTRRKNRIIQISLATLGDGAEEPLEVGKSNNNEEAQSNSIQKEIVKQLLFREAPHKVPNSKFKRISAPHKPYIIPLSTAIAIVTTGAIYYWLESSLYSLIGTGFLQILGAFTSLLLVMFSLTSLLLLWSHGKFTVGKLTSGPISFSRSDENNYFDQYLDELIYFFQMTDYDLVIFEDIERFDNAYIFVALKQLNNLLNDAGQIRAAKKRIRFIYAIRDSLFSKGKFAPYEESTNRAKFFDLIIPVVPFVTHQSSSDIMTRLFKTEGHINISKELIDIVAKYITDMRLIKNIYNEYVVFARKVLGKDRLEGLTEDRLFAMIAYKNTNLEDFEQIKLGGSNLDRIYTAYRRTISENIFDLQKKIAEHNRKLKLPRSMAARSEAYGDRLTSFLNVSTAAIRANNIEYALLGGIYTIDQMKDVKFWEAVSQMGGNDKLSVNYRASNAYYNSIPDTMSLSRSMLGEIVQGSLDLERLEADDIDQLKQELKQLRKELREMSYRSLEEILNLESSTKFRTQISEIVGKKDGENSLVYDLLSAGYIDENFTLYTSIFHGKHPRAVNFVLHHLKLNKPDFHYKFGGEDNIKALLDTAGSGYIRNKSIYNVEIIDHLLRHAKKRTPPNDAHHKLQYITVNLAQGEPEDRAFLDEYIQSGENPEKLMKDLSAKWYGIFDYISSRQNIPHSGQIKMFSAALEGASDEVQYLIEENTVTFITENAQHMEALTKPFDKRFTTSLGNILPLFNIKLSSFDRLSNDVQHIIVTNNLYEINKNNLESATNLTNLSLDGILAANETVFSYVVANLEDYLAAIANSRSTKYTVENSNVFPTIVDAIANQDEASIANVLKGRSNDCLIEDLTTVSSAVWPALLDARVVAPLSSNIIAYYSQDETGALDQHLADYLSSEGYIVVDPQNTEEEMQKLAVSILSDTQIDAKTRGRLVNDLKLKRWISVDAFPVQDSDLYGYLLEDNVIEDSASTYNHLKGVSPDTRRFYMLKSRHFREYVHELALDSDEIDIIASEADINPDVKRSVIAKLTAFDPKPSNSAIEALANFAVEHKMSLDAATLSMMIGATHAINSVHLINQSNESFTKDDMIQMLKAIGLNYARLSEPGMHVSLEDTPYNNELAGRLKALGMASTVSSRDTKSGNKLVINMKKRW